LAKCGSIFPEFRKSLIEEKKKEKTLEAAGDSKECEKKRTKKFLAKW